MSNQRRQFVVRSVFRLPDGSGGDHHYTLVSDPGHASGDCVIVNWTTRKHVRGEDASCILNRLDHPANTVESLVFYNGARLAPAAGVQRLIDTISDVLLGEDAHNRIMQGFQLTSQVPMKVYEFLDDAGFLPEMP